MSPFPPIFVLTDLVTLYNPQASGFQKLAKLKIFDSYNLVLSIQNVNAARFARNVECDFLGDFQTLRRACRIIECTPRSKMSKFCFEPSSQTNIGF